MDPDRVHLLVHRDTGVRIIVRNRTELGIDFAALPGYSVLALDYQLYPDRPDRP